MTDVSVECLTLLGLSSDTRGLQVWPWRPELSLQGCRALQLPGEQTQSTAVWLRKRQTGGALSLPPKSAGIPASLANWSLLNTWFKGSNENWNEPTISETVFKHPSHSPACFKTASHLLRLKRKFLLAGKVKREFFKDPWGKLKSASRKGKFKMPQRPQWWKSTFPCQGEERSSWMTVWVRNPAQNSKSKRIIKASPCTARTQEH